LAHKLHLLQSEASTFTLNKLIRLNKEYIAPNGQIIVQKGRLDITNKNKNTTKIIILITNNRPTRVLIAEDNNIKGTPASNAPCGQSLQNQGARVRRGIKIINPKRHKYFVILICLGILILKDFILYNKSCKNPNGHIHPQVSLPNNILIIPKYPTI
jgi:hypothetical protein